MEVFRDKPTTEQPLCRQTSTITLSWGCEVDASIIGSGAAVQCLAPILCFERSSAEYPVQPPAMASVSRLDSTASRVETPAGAASDQRERAGKVFPVDWTRCTSVKATESFGIGLKPGLCRHLSRGWLLRWQLLHTFAPLHIGGNESGNIWYALNIGMLQRLIYILGGRECILSKIDDGSWHTEQIVTVNILSIYCYIWIICQIVVFKSIAAWTSTMKKIAYILFSCNKQ